ncbi:MAG: hypothetical protein PEPC_01670 [Peptostreptococcus russellii]
MDTIIKINGEHYLLEGNNRYEVIENKLYLLSADGQESYLVDSEEYKNSDEYKAKMSKLEKEHKAMVNSKEFKEFWGIK